MAGEERRRAARAGALADSYQGRAAEGPQALRPVYERLTDLHRSLQARHVAAAALHEAFADRLERAAGSGDRSAVPHLMEAVAQTLGVRGAAAALHGLRDRSTVLMQASDSIAEAAYQLEARTGEGPVSAVLSSGTPVSARGPDLAGRWSRYGPAAAGMGIRATCAVPLRLRSVRLGVLCCYGTEPGLVPGIEQATDRIGGALTAMLLRAVPDDSLAALLGS